MVHTDSGRYGISRQYFYKKKNYILFFTIIVPDRSIIFPDQTGIFRHSLNLRTQQTILTCKRIYIIQRPQGYCKPLEQPKSKVLLRIECMTLRLQGYNFNFEIR